MACTGKRKRTIHLLSPEPETLSPLLPTHLPRSGNNTPTTQIMQKVWSKLDVTVIIKGIVDYIAEMGVDPMNNLDNFVEFINKNSSSSSYNVHDCSNITWNLRKNGVNVKNCTLHVEKRNSDDVGKKNEKGFVVGDKDLKFGENDSGKSVKKKKCSVVDDVRVLNLGMNDCGSVKKKGSIVDNVSISGKNDGGVSCLGSVNSEKKKKGSSVVENVSNSRWNDGDVSCLSSVKKKKRGCVSENELDSRKNDGGVGSSRTANKVKKSNLCENKSNYRKNDGGVSCSSSPNSVKKSKLSGKRSNSRRNDGGVSCLTKLSTVKKGGVWGKKGNRKKNVGGNERVSWRKDVKSKLGVDYGGVNCTKTPKYMKKRKWWWRNKVGVNKWKLGGRVRKKTALLVVGKKSVPKNKDVVAGNKQKDGMRNNNSVCANLSDFGCWDKNEVILREAVMRMISRRLSLRDELETDLLWRPPRIGVLKWNTDASVREDNKAAIGGVLRDWNGSFRCVFSCPLNCCGSNEAEVRAIYKALEIASCKDWLLNIHMVIESDSMSAVRWCNEDNGGPLNLGYMLNFIRKCKRWWPGLEIIYAGRKSNTVADRLSKQGHERSADFVVWM